MTPVERYGRLRVRGVHLCDRDGEPVQLRGMSTHGLQWYGHCLDEAALDTLAADWKADVLRIALYVQEGGYATDPRGFTDRVHEIVEAVTARGLYAIVDWHVTGDPHRELTRAETFFAEVAERHAGRGSVLYEIANEPSGVPWDRIRGYAERVVPVIRERDPDAVVLVGTRGWSSLGVAEGADEREVVEDPVDADGVMYAFHFYAASHGSEYLETLARAAARIPVFVSEFGTQEASGDGPDDFGRAEKYLHLMAEHRISWVNWNYSDDERSGAVFVPGTRRLKPAGAWVRERLRG